MKVALKILSCAEGHIDELYLAARYTFVLCLLVACIVAGNSETVAPQALVSS